MTFVAGNVLTAAQLNTHLRDNMLETAPGRASSANSIFVSQSPFRIEERTIKAGRVATSQSTTTSSYSDLATVGPSVTCTTGTSAIIYLNSTITPAVTDTGCGMSFAVTGDSNRSAQDKEAILIDGTIGGNAVRVGTNIFITDLTPGVNVFTAKYKSSGSNSTTFNDRFLGVLPL
jgi:hypothetical protein